jgi:hypothetical protein
MKASQGRGSQGEESVLYSGPFSISRGPDFIELRQIPWGSMGLNEHSQK